MTSYYGPVQTTPQEFGSGGLTPMQNASNVYRPQVEFESTTITCHVGHVIIVAQLSSKIFVLKVLSVCTERKIGVFDFSWIDERFGKASCS